MDEPRWLTEDEQRAWRKLAAVMTVLPAALDAQLQRDSDLTHFGYWVLAMLSESEDRALRMSVLATQANASPSRVSHVVARLENQGWVRRYRSAADARGNVAELTEAGARKVVDTAPGHVARVRELIFDGLSAEQVAELDRVGSALLDGIDPDRQVHRDPPA